MIERRRGAAAPLFRFAEQCGFAWGTVFDCSRAKDVMPWPRGRQGIKAMTSGVSQILAKTFTTMRVRFGSLVGLWGAFFVAQLLVTFIFAGAVGTSFATGFASGNPEALGGGMILSAIVFYLIYFMVYFAQSGALIAMASPLQEVSFGEAISAGARSAPTMLGVAVLFAVAYFLAALVVGVIIGVLSMIGTAATVILAFLLLPAAIYLSCRLSLISAVIPIERVWNPITAIGRTWALTRGHALTIFLVLVVFVAAALVLFGAVFYPFYSSITASATSGQPPDFGGFGLLIVGVVLVSILLAIAFSALFAAIHSELAGTTGQDFDKVFA